MSQSSLIATFEHSMMYHLSAMVISMVFIIHPHTYSKREVSFIKFVNNSKSVYTQYGGGHYGRVVTRKGGGKIREEKKTMFYIPPTVV